MAEHELRSSKEGIWVNPTGRAIRVDPAGDGHYGARRLRNGVSVVGAHRGIDLLCAPGQKVFSPIEAILLRDGRVYADDPIWRLVVLASGGLSIKLMYVQPKVDMLGRRVMPGDMVGIAQNIPEHYPNAKGMRPHVHVELRRNGNLMDPTPLFFA